MATTTDRTQLNVLFAPAEFEHLQPGALRATTAVVFDVLRATSSMVAALQHGAGAIIPAGSITEALALKQQHPDVLLAGERDGLRITAAHSGGVEFDFGNSPREFVPERVGGKLLIMTTTNGTRALRACAAAGAENVLIGCWLNLGALARHLVSQAPRRLTLVCAGTHEEGAYEDALAAGGLCDRLWPRFAAGHIADPGLMARELYLAAQGDLAGALRRSRNARRLAAIPELSDDLAFALQVDAMDVVGALGHEAGEGHGAIRRVGQSQV